ncbi:hypothetical protein AXF15_11570 [Desulfomicrobium orale DSM 12838]|uniref:J domain-containing protein n=1 Tax=Desulfomicrobium orale DSM 12838 TaxID=888061 RepID=A0A0X8JRI4_9BACT|nr:hypothetical protein AXF15_11570 [Desulfomicrobium orale DSM 12838]
MIKAAYRALSQKYHPDLNPENSDAHRIMRIINASYEVLSDPDKKKRYDEFLAQLEREQASAKPHPTQQATSKKQREKRPLAPSFFWVALGIFILTATIVPQLNHTIQHSKSTSSPPQALTKQTVTPEASQVLLEPVDFDPFAREPAKVKWTKPAYAPNGKPWPQRAGYISGYKQLHSNGHSSVTIDNSRCDTDVFGKLYSLSPQKKPVRFFYIPAHSMFTLLNVRKGDYDLRFEDMRDGSKTRSDPFQVTERKEQGVTLFDEITITLYKVRDGNMHMHAISEDEF